MLQIIFLIFTLRKQQVNIFPILKSVYYCVWEIKNLSSSCDYYDIPFADTVSAVFKIIHLGNEDILCIMSQNNGKFKFMTLMRQRPASRFIKQHDMSSSYFFHSEVDISADSAL